MTITVTSPAFAHGQPIPKKFTGDGDDHSPALSWSAGPAGTKQWALICDDPDAPTPEPWVHWVLYNIPANVTSLPENVPAAQSNFLEGKNSWPSGKTTGHRGPAPPKGHGVHRYHFKVYAVDSELGLKPGLDKAALLKAMQGHILDQGELIGTYQR